MSEYNFHYEESGHSRKINHKTIMANNYGSVFDRAKACLEGTLTKKI